MPMHEIPISMRLRCRVSIWARTSLAPSRYWPTMLPQSARKWWRPRVRTRPTTGASGAPDGRARGHGGAARARQHGPGTANITAYGTAFRLDEECGERATGRSMEAATSGQKTWNFPGHRSPEGRSGVSCSGRRVRSACPIRRHVWRSLLSHRGWYWRSHTQMHHPARMS